MLAVAEREQLPVAQARTGEPAAWDVLFRRYQLPIYVYVFELVHDEQASLDIVQETFIAATKHLDSLRDDGKFGSWLFGIAHQKCIQRWRKQSREELLRDEIGGEPDELENDPSELLIRREAVSLSSRGPTVCSVLRWLERKKRCRQAGENFVRRKGWRLGLVISGK